MSEVDEAESLTSSNFQSTFGKKGLIVHGQTREVVANVIKFMRDEAEHFRRTNEPLIPIMHFRERILAATNISTKLYRDVQKQAAEIEAGTATCFSTPSRKERSRSNTKAKSKPRKLQLKKDKQAIRVITPRELNASTSVRMEQDGVKDC